MAAADPHMRDIASKKRKVITVASSIGKQKVASFKSKMAARGRSSTVGAFTAGRKSRPERKNLDTNQATHDVPLAGVITLINGIVQGNTAQTMIGRKAVMKSVQIRCAAQGKPQLIAAVNTFGEYRMIVVYDKEPNGALPAVTDVLTNAQPNNPLQLANSDRFTVLLDEYYNLGAGSTTATQAFYVGAGNCTIDRYRKISLDMLGPATSATTGAGIETGSIFVLEISSGVGPQVESSWYSRVRYEDA